jgi:hypothetical protein
MSNSKKHIESNPCNNDWDKMRNLEASHERFCNSCSTSVKDLSEVDLFSVDQKELNGKCIRVKTNQLDDLMFLHPIKRFAAAAFIVFGSSLFNISESFAMETDLNSSKQDSTIFKGKVLGNKNQGLKAAIVTLFIDGKEYGLTLTGEYGNYSFKVNKEDFSALTKFRIVVKTGDNVKEKQMKLSHNVKLKDEVTFATIKTKGKQEKVLYSIGCASF